MNKMTASQNKKISKFLSFILRHNPGAIDLALDQQGWANIDELIEKANSDEQYTKLTREMIQEIVDSNDKKRFIISEDGQSIRANQGHSINIDLNLPPTEPPAKLYHGTASRFVDDILVEGLKPQKRQHVHLSVDVETATAVGQRYGKPVILTIDTDKMHQQGMVFYRAENGVWLTEHVPVAFIQIA